MLIGINGRMGSGKDTVGEIIQKLCITNGVEEPHIKKFAGKLKLTASILTGISVEKFEDQDFKKTLLGPEWGTVKENPLNSIEPFKDVNFNQMMSVRELLQKLGTEAMRNGLHTNVWVNALFADYKPNTNWLITDMRFPNEMEAVTSRNGITIKVNRVLDTKSDHYSEIALDNAEFDYTIDNNGTMEELVEKVRSILKKEKII